MMVVCSKAVIDVSKSGGCGQVFPPEQLNELLAGSDYVVMALPHTPATDKLVGKARLCL